MTYKDQFTPHAVDENKNHFIDAWDYNPQCKEDVQLMSDSAFIYDLYFGLGGVICGAPKNSPS